MRFSHLSPAGIAWMSPVTTGAAAQPESIGDRAEKDRRWPAMLRRLKGLRKRGRRSIRIVDADCGAGDLLIHAARRARELGFVAIEGRGVDTDPRFVAQAQRTAAWQADPAIGLVFELGHQCEAMREETDFPADLLLCSATGDDAREIADLARMAGDTVLCDRREATGGERR